MTDTVAIGNSVDLEEAHDISESDFRDTDSQHSDIEKLESKLMINEFIMDGLELEDVSTQTENVPEHLLKNIRMAKSVRFSVLKIYQRY